MKGGELSFNKIGQPPQQESDHLNVASRSTSTLFGRKAIMGVLIGLAIIILDLLFFTYIVPVRTTTQFIETVGFLVLGVLIWAFSTVAGLMRVSNARRVQ
jgi:hypothetical protein